MLRVAVVGRPNVGKSTLFNRLVGRRLALVGAQPGLTRDWREGVARLGPARFHLIDTAGLEDALDDTLEARALAHTDALLDDADLVLFTLDARAGLTPLDRHFAGWLRRRSLPVLVLVNKAEGTAGDHAVAEAYRLGLGDPIPVSGQEGEGLGQLYEAMVAAFPELADGETGGGPADDTLRLAVVGRPNVGKSTLVNRLLGAARVLTGPEAGTTRDAVTVPWRWYGRDGELVDTAGLRRRSRVTGDAERVSIEATRRAIGACQVAALMIDATGPMDKQDFTIARRIVDEGRATVVVANKWDLVAGRDTVRRQRSGQLEAALSQARGIAVVPVSARTGSGIERMMEAVFDVRETWSRRLPTAALNRWLTAMLDHHPPPLDGGRRVRIRYVTQVSARPPSFALFVNRPQGLPAAYQRYLVNGLRESFELPGVPIRLLMRSGRNPYAPER